MSETACNLARVLLRRSAPKFEQNSTVRSRIVTEPRGREGLRATERPMGEQRLAVDCQRPLPPSAVDACSISLN
jgi:hypothetical protein